MPASHRAEFAQVQRSIEKARERNAHERCRRFAAASLKVPKDDALRHAETRGEDLSQVRPEYNHATDAMCIVGRRDWSRGLFLDRRAFLTSYDPAQDDADSSILFHILAAAIPVCAGINLEYYFSTVDNVNYGSGSKLPHNLVALLGVMEGASSDLRTGLYAQMVEIHEPMRLLFLIETTPEVMLSIMDRHAGIGILCRRDRLDDTAPCSVCWLCCARWESGLTLTRCTPSRPTIASTCWKWYSITTSSLWMS